MVLGVLGYAAFEFVGQATGHAANATHAALSTPSGVPRHGTASAAPQTARAAATATAAAPAGTTTPATTTAPAVPPPVRTLFPVSAVAFGPQGTADGDDPQNAARVLTDPSQGWLTDWYTTPDFGELKTGTGLLLDLGRTFTITTVRVALGFPGADFQLRAGTVPGLTTLPVVATAARAGDVAELPLAVPVRARYVLLWFTRLPPDGAGTYQVFVHQVTVQGRP